MNQINQILTKLGIKPQGTYPQLLPGDPVLRDNQERYNMEMSARELLGTLILPSNPRDLANSFAVFMQANGKGPELSLEIHTDDSKLKPITHSVGESVTLLPKLAQYPAKRKVYDITVILTAHVPQQSRYRARMRRNQEKANNQAHRQFFEKMEYHWAPAGNNAGVVRNLWVIAPTKHVVPTTSGEKRGTDGRVITYPESGDTINSLVYRRPFRSRRLKPDKDGTYFHEEYAAPDQDPVEGPDFLDVDGTLYAFFKGGVINSETLPQLARMPVDILMRLEWREGSSKLYITPLLRASGKRAQLESLREDLDDMGGWKLIRTKPHSRVSQMEAFRAFIPGNPPLPPKFGRREVEGWSNIDPNKGLLGLPQLLAKDLSPVGNPLADLIVGFVKRVGYTMESGPGWLVTSRSEGGKSTAVALLSQEREPKTFWVDITGDRRGSPPYWTSLFGGLTWYVNCPDAESIYLTETGQRGTPEQIALLRQELEDHDSLWVDKILQRMLENSIKKGKWLYYPFCMHPTNYTGRYLDLVAKFLGKLPEITSEWLALKGEGFGVVVNDFSHLLTIRNTGSDWEKQKALNAGEAAVWYCNHGSNHGAGSFTLITHYERDPDTLLQREVLSTFAHLLRGASDESEPDYQFDLVVPNSITPANIGGTVEARLDLRIYDEELLELVERLTPSFGKQFMEQEYSLPEILKPPEFTFTTFNSNGWSPSRPKVRQNVRPEA